MNGNTLWILNIFDAKNWFEQKYEENQNTNDKKCEKICKYLQIKSLRSICIFTSGNKSQNFIKKKKKKCNVHMYKLTYPGHPKDDLVI